MNRWSQGCPGERLERRGAREHAGAGRLCLEQGGGLSLTQALRAELAKQGVRTFAVFPGPVDTEMIRSIEIPKTSPAAVATTILDGVEGSLLDIFPDPMSQEVGALFTRDPRAVEQRFAAPM